MVALFSNPHTAALGDLLSLITAIKQSKVHSAKVLFVVQSCVSASVNAWIIH